MNWMGETKSEHQIHHQSSEVKKNSIRIDSIFRFSRGSLKILKLHSEIHNINDSLRSHKSRALYKPSMPSINTYLWPAHYLYYKVLYSRGKRGIIVTEKEYETLQALSKNL